MFDIIDQTCSLLHSCEARPHSHGLHRRGARTWFAGRDNPPLTPDGDNQTGTTMAAGRKFDNCSSLTANTVAATTIPRMECADSLRFQIVCTKLIKATQTCPTCVERESKLFKSQSAVNDSWPQES